MQKEQDLTVRARPKLAAWALRCTRVFAAVSCVRVRLIAAPLCGLFLLACGSERPAWYGFPVLPPDAGAFELTPDLAARLLAAQAAFEAQPAAGHAAVDAGAASTSTPAPTGPRNASAGSAASATPTRAAEAGRRASEMSKRRTLDPTTAGAAAPTADAMQHTEASDPSGTAKERAGDEHEAGHGAPEPPPSKPELDLDAGIPADDADGGA